VPGSRLPVGSSASPTAASSSRARSALSKSTWYGSARAQHGEAGGGDEHAGQHREGAFEAAVGPQWGPLNIGHLYQVLERLSRDDLVTSHRVAQSVKPDRVVYEITDAGRTELADWLAAPTPRTSGFRDDFFLKVMAAARSGDAETVRAVITGQRGFLLRELRNLETLRRRPGVDRVAGLLVTAATQHVGADLTFLDMAEEQLLSDDAALTDLARPTLPRPDDTQATATG
jgi:DNA-binding PadR family transcriptional regulator